MGSHVGYFPIVVYMSFSCSVVSIFYHFNSYPFLLMSSQSSTIFSCPLFKTGISTSYLICLFVNNIQSHNEIRDTWNKKTKNITFIETGESSIIEEIVVSLFTMALICELWCFVAQTSTTIIPPASYFKQDNISYSW